MNVASHIIANIREAKGIERLNHLYPHQTMITPKPILQPQPDWTWNVIRNPSLLLRNFLSQYLLKSKHRSLGPRLRPTSQALQKSKPRPLDPKSRLLPQDLLCILIKPVKGFLGLWEITLRPPPPQILKYIWKTKDQNIHKHPNIPWNLEKGNDRPKTSSINWQNHVIDSKRTVY